MFGLVLAFVHWGSICVFSLHHHWAYPRVSCLMTFCVLSWLLFYTGAYPHPWVHRIFLQILSLLDLLLDLHGSSHWGIPPILEFIRSFVYFLTARSISRSLWVIIPGHTPFSTFPTGSYTSLFGFAMSRADFMIDRRICRSLGHPPIVIFVWGIPPLSFTFGASPHCHLRLGHPPTVISFGASPHCYLRLGHPPTVIYVWGIPSLSVRLGHPPLSFRLGHPPTVILFRASSYFWSV